MKEALYQDYRKTSDIHSLALYPAVMVAPMQHAILDDLIKEGGVKTVFDAFHGSGTSLYETKLIDPAIHVTGYDINPLANLITRTKLDGVDQCTIDSDWYSLLEFLLDPKNVQPLDFPNIDKWIRADIADSIAEIRAGIMTLESKKNRQFFWCILSDVIRKYSNTRSSTYKLHLKTDSELSRLNNGVKDTFIKRVNNELPKFTHNFSAYQLLKCDTLEQIAIEPDRKFDISITSPPYGDNATTVPYGQFSMLSLYIINSSDLELCGWEKDNYSSIDSRSLGGTRKKRRHVFTSKEETLLEPIIAQLSSTKINKVRSFFADYFLFLAELQRVTNKYIILTLGNRTVDRKKISLSEVTKQFFADGDFILLEEYGRNIPKKRIPRVTSIVKKSPVSSMNREYTLIFKRSVIPE